MATAQQNTDHLTDKELNELPEVALRDLNMLSEYHFYMSSKKDSATPKKMVEFLTEYYKQHTIIS